MAELSRRELATIESALAIVRRLGARPKFEFGGDVGGPDGFGGSEAGAGGPGGGGAGGRAESAGGDGNVGGGGYGGGRGGDRGADSGEGDFSGFGALADAMGKGFGRDPGSSSFGDLGLGDLSGFAMSDVPAAPDADFSSFDNYAATLPDYTPSDDSFGGKNLDIGGAGISRAGEFGSAKSGANLADIGIGNIPSLGPADAAGMWGAMPTGTFDSVAPTPADRSTQIGTIGKDTGAPGFGNFGEFNGPVSQQSLADSPAPSSAPAGTRGGSGVATDAPGVSPGEALGTFGGLGVGTSGTPGVGFGELPSTGTMEDTGVAEAPTGIGSIGNINRPDGVQGLSAALDGAFAKEGLAQPSVQGKSAVLGNLSWESGGNSNMQSGVDASTGINWGPAPNGLSSAVGAAQWLGPRAADLAKGMGYENYKAPEFRSALAANPMAQIDYIAREIAGNATPGAVGIPGISASQLERVLSSPVPVRDATSAYERAFERSGARSSDNSRTALADRFASGIRAGDRNLQGILQGAKTLGGVTGIPAGLGYQDAFTPSVAPTLAAPDRFNGPPIAPAAAPAIAAIDRAIGTRAAPTPSAVAPSVVEAPGPPISSPFGNLPGRSVFASAPPGAPAGRTGLASVAPAPSPAPAAPAARAPAPVAATPVTVAPAAPATVATAPATVAPASPTTTSQPPMTGRMADAGDRDRRDVKVEVPGVVAGAGRMAASTLAGSVVPGLGLASLASGLLGGPTLGSVLGGLAKDPKANSAAAEAFQNGFQHNGGEGQGTIRLPEAAPQQEAPSSGLAEALAAATSGKTPAQLAYEASVASRGGNTGYRPAPGPQVVNSGLIAPKAPAPSDYVRALYAMQGLPLPA